MNEDAAIQAIKTVINNAKATLVTEIETGGVAREIVWLSDTLLHVPPAYYAVGIHCEGAREHSDPNIGTSANPSIVPAFVEYSMLVLIAEGAYPEQGEGIPYSTTHSAFRKLCDRVVKLIRQDTKWFPAVGSDPRFRLKIDPREGQVVEKENFDLEPEEDGVPILGSAIRFTLIDHCSDSSKLY